MSSNAEQYNRVWGYVGEWCGGWMSSNAEQYNGGGDVWGSGVVAGCHPMQSSTTGVGMCGGVVWWLDVIQCRAVQRGWGCVGEWCGGWMSSNAEQYNGGGDVWGSGVVAGCHPMQSSTTGVGSGVGDGVVAGCHPMQSSTLNRTFQHTCTSMSWLNCQI